MTDPLWSHSALDDRRAQLAAARADFLSTGEVEQAGVPESVAASWRRSRLAGLDADTYDVPFDPDIDTDSRLARCARPVLSRLEQDMYDVPVSIALSDAHARIIDRRDCSPDLARELDRVDFNPGFSFGEEGIGTNGVGTAFEARQPVSVVGAAHFTEALTPFACTGAPVLDPLTGRVEGVLDVSLLAVSWTPVIHALVASAASDIGRNLLLDRGRGQQALFEAYLRIDARTTTAVIAVGESVMVNARARRMLTPEDLDAVQMHARHLMPQIRCDTDELMLPGGRRLRLRVVRVPVGEDLAGVVLVATEAVGTGAAAAAQGARRDGSAPAPTAPRAASASPSSDPAPDVQPSTSPTWCRARDDLRSGLAVRRRIVVTGEPGSGRFTLLANSFHDLHPTGRQLSLVAAELREESRLDLSERAEETLVIVRNLDTVNGAGAGALQELTAILDRHPRVRLAATCTAGDVGTDAGSALACFEDAVHVPALRHRATDIAELSRQMLADLAPGRTVRIGAAARRVLAAYPWPGNLRQLHEALAEAVGRRPVGELRVEDLPAYCRTSGQRSLTPLEAAERDAIVAALAQCGGNRQHAAKALGMARSSLYRKLRAYAITEV